MHRSQRIARRIVVLWVTGLGLSAAGCAGQHWPAKLEDLGGSRVPGEWDAIDVALAPSDRNHLDTWSDRYEPKPRSVYTGPTWAKVFRGDPATRPVFTLKNTALLEDNVGDGHRATYVAEGTLSFGGREYVIHAQGRAVTSQWPSRAFPQAVGKCIVEASHQVSRIIAAGPGTGAAGTDPDPAVDAARGTRPDVR